MGDEGLSCWASVTLTARAVLQAKGDPWRLNSKESVCSVEAPGSILGQEGTPRREWLPTPVVLPGESHGQRSLAGYSSWGRKELDTTE